MKKGFTVLCITAALAAAVSLSSCSGGEDSGGGLFGAQSGQQSEQIQEEPYEHEFVELSELVKQEYYLSLKDNEALNTAIKQAKEDGKKAYACVIGKDTPAKLKVPAECEGGVVLAVVGTEDGNDTISDLTIEEGVEVVSDLFRTGGKSLQFLSVPHTLTQMINSFNGCSSLQGATMICTLQEFGNSFNNCSSLKTLTMGSINCKLDASLKGNDALESVTFEGAVNIIKDSEYADVNTDPPFASAPSLKEIKFKGEVTELPSYFCYEAPKLETINFGGKVGKLGYSAFADCDSIKKLTFTGDVDTIDSYAFSDCDSLGEVTFTGSVNEIHSSAFNNSVLTSLEFKGDVNSLDNCFSGYSDDSTKIDSIVFDGNVASIEKCFRYNSALKSLEFKGKPTSIKDSFNDAVKLEKVSFISGAGIIDDSFHDCTALKTLTFKGNVNNIDSSFVGCSSLETLTFLGKLEYLRGISFCDSDDNPGSTKIDYTSLPEGVDIDGYGVKSKFDPNAAKLKPYFEKTEKYDYDHIKEFLKSSVLGKSFPSDKEISPSAASQYADVLNFATYTDDTHCTDCYYEDYNEEIAQEQMKGNVYSDPKHFYNDVNGENSKYPVFTVEKAEKVISGEAPLVLGVAESMGYIPVTYTDDSDSTHTETYYYKVFRASLWNIETGELIAWWVHQDGEAPASFNTRDIYDYMYHENIGTRQDGVYFFNGEYRYPFTFLCQTIFGKPEDN